MRHDGLFILGDGIAARATPSPGERVLWIHGYTMDSSTWEELWRLLPDWYHVGLDLPGHGASRPIRHGEDLRALAIRVGELALKRGVRHIVALSFGTMLALQVAIEFPNAFVSLVVGAPALAGGPQDSTVAVRYSELARLYHERGAGAHMAALWMLSPPDIFKGLENRPHLRERLFDVISRHSWREFADGSMLLLTSPTQGEGQLRKIQAATLVLIGEEELPAFRSCARMIRETIPSCEGVQIQSAGHLCLLEAPNEAAALIDAHLRRQSPTLLAAC
jgi:pimeloyl-ACP methyl ester carboxylesterase